MALSVLLDYKKNLWTNKYVAIHPTPALSIVDHYTRVAKGTTKRVAGVLLGEIIEGQIHATNSFAVPFEEDPKNENLWFLDHTYLESMAYMFAKISRKEKIIGWYSTGSGLKPADLEINELFRTYVAHPVYLLVNVHQSGESIELPFKAYMSFDEPCSDKLFRRTFAHVSCGVAQFEAEEVGVEHSLRDIETYTTSTQTTKILDRISGLKCLAEKFGQIASYLEAVKDRSLPMNAQILINIQEIFNYSPNVTDSTFIEALEKEITLSMLGIYTGSIVRSVLALHDLVKNRISLSESPSSKDQNKSLPKLNKSNNGVA